MKKCFRFVLIVALALLVSAPEKSAAAYKLKKGQLVKVTVAGKKVLCGLTGKKWSVVKKSGAKYEIDKKAKTAAKAACKKLLAPEKIKNLLNLSQLPDTGSLAGAAVTSSALTAAAVSGVPPVLSEIPRQDLSALFWREGVIDSIIDGTAGQNQCSEFFSGQSDGASGGMAACFLTQSVGYAFHDMLSTGASLCYMKKIPTRDNLAAGAIALLSGALPDNDVERIFQPAPNAARLVKVLLSGMPSPDPEAVESEDQEIFIKVASESENQKAGNQYRAELFFCRPGQAEPQAYESTSVHISGLYQAEHLDGGGQIKISGYLKPQDNRYIFDSSKTRNAEVFFAREGPVFKGSIAISGDNIIRNRTYDDFGFGERKAYAVTRFAGSNMANLQFLEGAVKEVTEQHSGGMAVEYRDGYYAAASRSSLKSLLDEIDLETDSFYRSLALPEVALPGFDCITAAAEVTVSVDMTNPAIAPLFEVCESDILENMDFCANNETLAEAFANFAPVCLGDDLPPPEEE